MSTAEASGRPTRPARVERIVDHNDDTRSLFLAPADGKPIKFVPGQFISIQIPLDDEIRTRAYSIASSPEEAGAFEVVFNRVANGRGVAWLFERKVGDQLTFIGPFGSFTLERAPAVETVFIAEGTAIAPIRSMLRRASASPEHARLELIHAVRSEPHLLYRTEFEQLARSDSRFTFETIVDRPERIYPRLIALVKRRWVDGDADRSRQFYLCGVGKPVVELRDLLRGAGYERRCVRYEQW